MRQWITNEHDRNRQGPGEPTQVSRERKVGNQWSGIARFIKLATLILSIDDLRAIWSLLKLR